MSKKIIWLMVCVLLVAVFAGCSRNREAGNDNNANSIGSNNNGGNNGGTDNEAAAYPLQFTDDLGRTVTLERKPERLVSLLPSLTETIFAVGAGERLVGVTTFCNYPEEALEIEKIGNLYDLNIELILSLEPDLVLTGRSETLQQSLSFLDDNKIPYVVVDPQSLDEIGEAIIKVGTLLDCKAEGEALAAKLSAERAELEAKAAAIPEAERPRVFVLLDPESLWTVGDGEYLSEMIAAAGGVNVAAEQGSGYFQLSEEVLLTIDPDVFICTYPMRDQVMAKAGWQSLSAVKNGRVYDVSSDPVSRPGPRFVQGLEELYGIFSGHEK
ncbi:MAG: cobalamin-binding protein [Firmicutes bacterium]|nr:cobalamin-binding protein [Bacillota bacterium]